jgi:hypothetical protein
VVPARLISQVYLGDQRDLRFELGDGTLVRAVTPSSVSLDSGSDALLHFPVRDCQLVDDVTAEV